MLGLLRARRGEVSSGRGRRVFCPCCGGKADFLVSSSDRNRKTTRSVFEYFDCGTCGLVFIDPAPQDLRPFYEGGYQKIPSDLKELRELAAVERYRMKPILRYRQGGKLLEIGPWMGLFSCNAKDAGFDVTAIEIDQGCVDFLNKTVGIRAIQSSDPAATLGSMDELFDVIALWHSLEHLATPWLVLERAAKCLTPGGILLVALPNIESYEFKLLRAAWVNLDAPRHLYFYPVASFASLGKRLGLAELEITTTDELSDALSLYTWRSVATSIVPIRYLRGALAYVLKHFANRKELRDNSGPGITAVFQRLSLPLDEGRFTGPLKQSSDVEAGLDGLDQSGAIPIDHARIPHQEQGG